MIETIDIRNKSLATMANMVSDWSLGFYTLHAIIANGFVFPDCSTVSGQSSKVGKPPQTRRWSKSGLSYGGQPRQ